MNHLHNDSNKSSAVNITDDNRDVNDTSVKDTDKISKSSNGNSIKIKSRRWDGNSNKKHSQKISV